MFREIIAVYSQNHRNVQGFLDAFAKQLRKTTLSFVLSVLPSSWKIWTPLGRVFMTFILGVFKMK